MLVSPQLAVLRLHWRHRSYFPSWSVRVWPPNLKETADNIITIIETLALTSSDLSLHFCFSLVLAFSQPSVIQSIHLTNYPFVARTSWCSVPLGLAGVWGRRCAASSPRTRPAEVAAFRSDRFALLTFCKHSVRTTKETFTFHSNLSNKPTAAQFWDACILCPNDKNESFSSACFSEALLGFVTHSLCSLCIISLSVFCSFKRFSSISLILSLAVFISASEMFCALRLCSAKAAGLQSISPNTGCTSNRWEISEQRRSV